MVGCEFGGRMVGYGMFVNVGMIFFSFCFVLFCFVLN